MGEIIHIQVGQCGNQIGASFWNEVLREHHIDRNGYYQGSQPHLDLSKSQVYFTESEIKRDGQRQFKPRTLCADLEPGVLASLQADQSNGFGNLLSPNDVIHGINGASNNWARGHYTEGAELIEPILENVRKKVEQCDRLQGFQLCHSLGGGTGSGLGTLLVSKVREDFPEKMMATFSVVPSPKVSDTVVEPYNALLASHHLVENADECFLLDNEALYNIAARVYQPVPTYAHLNSLVARAMAGATASVRFPGQLNSDLRKIATNMIPFPRLHFFAISYSPLHQSRKVLAPNHLVRDLFLPHNTMCAIDIAEGKYITAATMFRGPKISSRSVEEAIASVRAKYASGFCVWIPNNITFSMSSTSPQHSVTAATGIINSTSMMELFQRIDVQFSAMYRRKAFLHSYIQEGMDEYELTESQSNIQDLVNEYMTVAENALELPFDDDDDDAVGHANQSIDGDQLGDQLGSDHE